MTVTIEVLDDRELEAQHDTLRRLTALIDRVERERTATGDIVRAALKGAEQNAFVGTNEDWAEENSCCELDEVHGRQTVDGYLASLLTHANVVPAVIAQPLAALALGSVDPQFRCKLRNVPSRAVSVKRSWAHVESLRLGLGKRDTARMARLVTLALLNRREARGAHEEAVEVNLRNPVSKMATVGGERSRPTEHGSQPSQDASRRDDRPRNDALPQSGDEDAVAAPPGREVTGFGEATKDLMWQIDGQSVKMAKGCPLLVVAPTDAEREAMRGAQELVIWWRDRARRLPVSAVQPIRKARYVELNAEKREGCDS